MNTVIFVGPSLPLGEARKILPNAIYRPPAEQGDLLTAHHQDGADIIGLIDGTFHQTLSVWHSEVCYLLSKGVAVFGASSMGALRAVETERFGAIGIGRIFEWYRDGKICADDEVALWHAPAEFGFAPVSLTLVNIRASLEAGCARGWLTASEAEQVLEAARSIYYPARLPETILDRCERLELSTSSLQAVERLLTTDHVDQKKLDARKLVETVGDVVRGKSPLPSRVEFEFSQSTVFENLYNLDRKVMWQGSPVSLQSIREHAALNCPEYSDVSKSALDRSIVVYFASLLGLKPSGGEVARLREAFARKRGFKGAQELLDWLQRSGMGADDFEEYITEEALCIRLRRWIMASRRMDRGCRAVLDEARMRNLFVDWARGTVEGNEIFSAFRHEPEYEEMLLQPSQKLAERHNHESAVQIDGDAQIWAEDAGFEDIVDLREALKRSVVISDVKGRIERQMRAIDLAQGAAIEGAETLTK